VSRAEGLTRLAAHLRILARGHHHDRRPIAPGVGEEFGQAQQGQPSADARPYKRRVLADTAGEDDGVETIE
jgi:hypothetical protein